MPQLQRELFSIAGIGGVSLLLLTIGLQLHFGAYLAGQWLIVASLLWTGMCYFCWSRLDLNRPNQTASLYPTLGWGNRLTLLRGSLIAFTGGFLLLPLPDTRLQILAACFYTLAAIIDRLDGFIARRTQQVSLLGNTLDINFDALGLLLAPILAISWGKVHSSYLILSFAYYIYQWALRQRAHAGLCILPLPENPLRRTLAGFQMGFIACSLWPLFKPEFTVFASICLMLPVVFGFLVDWWVLTGRCAIATSLNIGVFSQRYCQPVLRICIILAIVHLSSTPAFTELPNSIILGLALSSLLLTLGCLGRLGALGWLVFLGLYPLGLDQDLSYKLLIIANSWLLVLGCGRFSLWQADDLWVARYDGA